MVLAAVGQRNPGQHHVADDGVHERRWVVGLEDALPGQPFRRPGRPDRGQAGLPGDQREVGAVAEDRDGTGHSADVRRLPAQAGDEMPAQRVRTSRLDGRGSGRVRPHATGSQDPQQFADEQRIAVGDRVTDGAELGGGLLTEGLADQARDSRRAEILRLQQSHVTGGEQVVEQAGVAFLRSAGDNHRDGHAVQPSRHETEEPQRRQVQPLRVVDDDHHRGLRREVDQQPVQPVEQRIQRMRGFRWFVERGEQAFARPCGAGEQAPRIGLRDGLLEQLPHGTEREVPLQLGAVRRQHGETRCQRPIPRMPQQCRLAKSGRCLHDHDAPTPGRQLTHRQIQSAHLVVALQQRISHRLPPGTRPPDGSTSTG